MASRVALLHVLIRDLTEWSAVSVTVLQERRVIMAAVGARFAGPSLNQSSGHCFTPTYNQNAIVGGSEASALDLKRFC